MIELSDAGNHLGQHVRVVLKEGQGRMRSGFLYTVDPESGNMILLDCDKTPPSACVVMQHAIASVQMDPERWLGVKTMDIILKRPSFEYLDPAWLKARHEALVMYLDKHRIPFRQDADDPVIHVLGRARVEPPYVITSVFSDNQIIGNRVRELVIKLG